MIPDFKTYIGESVWNDIRRRSNGTDVKKEDDVDFLEPQAFVEYLRNLYKNIDTDFYIFKDLNDIITVPTFETELGTKSTWFIEYDCNKKAVYIWKHFLNKEDKLFDKLNNDYKLTFIRRNSTENFLVEPKTGKSSNKFFIEIINYILENASVFCKRILVKNDKLSESVWNDIRRRGIGTDVKAEDDNKFRKEFERIKQMELIHPKVEWHLGVDYEWTPCNFGAESYDQPGWYLNSEEIVELAEYLKSTNSGYEIAGNMAFDILRNRRFEKKKIGKWWYYIFGREGDTLLYIPNFGCYSEGSNTLHIPIKTTPMYYGCCWPKDGAGYTQIQNDGKSLLTKTYIESNQTSESDRFQVRLVKRIS